jgi:hypothetical protein
LNRRHISSFMWPIIFTYSTGQTFLHTARLLRWVQTIFYAPNYYKWLTLMYCTVHPVHKSIIIAKCKEKTHWLSLLLHLNFRKFVTKLRPVSCVFVIFVVWFFMSWSTMNFHFPQQEKIEHLKDRQAADIQHVKRRCREENTRLLDKMRDMREELLWYKVSRIQRSESAA